MIVAPVPSLSIETDPGITGPQASLAAPESTTNSSWEIASEAYLVEAAYLSESGPTWNTVLMLSPALISPLLSP